MGLVFSNPDELLAHLFWHRQEEIVRAFNEHCQLIHWIECGRPCGSVGCVFCEEIMEEKEVPMSKASEFAKLMQKVPPSFETSERTFSVHPSGGLVIWSNRSRCVLDASDALKLRDWLTATFGEVPEEAP